MATTSGPNLGPGQHKYHIVALEATFTPIPEFDFPHTITRYPLTEAGEVEERIKDADIVITSVREVTPAMLATASRVRCIIICAVGIAWLDKEGFAKAGVTVTNCPGCNVEAVAGHALSLYFGLRRKIIELDSSIKSSTEWSDKGTLTARWKSAPRGLNQEVVGILGYGTIGKRLEELFEGLGAKVLVSDRKGSSVAREGRRTFQEVLKLASVIVLTLPKADDTVNLIGAPEFEVMQEDALVINVARGGIVNEKDLAQALRARRIGGAATDVLEVEPSAPGTCPLLPDMTKGDEEIPNLILSPHVAWYTQTTIDNYRETIKEGGERWVAGTLETDGQINPIAVVHNGKVWR